MIVVTGALQRQRRMVVEMNRGNTYENKINKAMKVLKVVLNIFMWRVNGVHIFLFYVISDSEETAMLIHSTFGYFITFLIVYALYRMAKKLIFHIDTMNKESNSKEV